MIARLGALGIDASRIEFATHGRRRPYLRNYNNIDVALDTVPYNGHTTSMDAMWMGVPVVTLLGHTVVGRAGLSQLTNLGLSDLAAHDEAGFIRIATELAADIPRLRELRAALRERMRLAAGRRRPFCAAWKRRIERCGGDGASGPHNRVWGGAPNVILRYSEGST